MMDSRLPLFNPKRYCKILKKILYNIKGQMTRLAICQLILSLFIAGIVTAILCILLSNINKRDISVKRLSKMPKGRGNTEAGSCSKTSCGAIDPVNEPDYNVREVIKNTILIEQHLAEKNKYCKQCLVKHFLLSIGLLEEAIWMAGSNDYPQLSESLKFYEPVFQAWFRATDDEKIRLDTLEKLRLWRRDMSDIYFKT